MEKHHRLRRDPSWSVHGCNLCGQEGHQAANCSNGTVNWREKFGKDAFILRDERIEIGQDTIDYDGLTRQAKQYAQAKLAALNAVDPATLQQIVQAEFGHLQQQQVAMQMPAAAPAPVAAPPSTGGWQTFYDNMKRPYYFQASTGTTQWEKPPELQ
mmetsp:Transcript_2695/g.3070  ORF Transcript_2695/g.3070 Transcript_2695/m.3070 type:complete len:156 (+) Transcript_2695:135-602(+)|eukprot:CAMPEP_0197857532 /NCGR_PEP_ID=MMETSP1438-20131217/30692_1 /TAXON_ID=1461541 /ORGANISM="Pterosperma sp., Strain CCMP1384" /LENGTH=155 /DNA_ID=CAMNT_0043473397 /DNA_START=134 /DNA_END=601 /DNA_ORIENTATION=+